MFFAPSRLSSQASRSILIGVLLLFIGTVPVDLIAAAPDTVTQFDHLDAAELIRRAVKHDEVVRHASAEYLHDEEVTTERFDSAGQRTSVQNERRRNVATHEHLGASENLQGDHPAAAGVANDTSRESENFAVVVDLSKLASHFDLKREPDGTAEDGRRCYVVSFRPAGQDQSDDSREATVLHQLAGRFWLAKDDLSIVQSEGALTHAVSVAWVASVYRLDFHYRSQTLPGTNVTMPAKFTLDLGVKAPFYHAHQRQTTKMSGFRRE